MPEFYIIIARKKYFLEGGGARAPCPTPPPSPTPMHTVWNVAVQSYFEC